MRVCVYNDVKVKPIFPIAFCKVYWYVIIMGFIFFEMPNIHGYLHLSGHLKLTIRNNQPPLIK